MALLREHGFEPQIIEYLKTPLNVATLAQLLELLGLEARALLRKQEPEYAALGLNAPGVTTPALLAAMAAHPVLIERPIVVANGRAVIGRPPENINTLFAQ